eukprot:TRINITY_DN3339_c0_g1_i2.p1 TRINITY_DN3339_c0_g1~~TRINITY_DN3339_c0_g1_i2.p1  ORF type:complete len:103 (+),score=4.84 TRINITY_DN3339_c0_g1_i2:631-939(+)
MYSLNLRKISNTEPHSFEATEIDHQFSKKTLSGTFTIDMTNVESTPVVLKMTKYWESKGCDKINVNPEFGEVSISRFAYNEKTYLIIYLNVFDRLIQFSLEI